MRIFCSKIHTSVIPRCTSCGFTLLFAVLTSSLLMIIGFSVFRLTLKEAQLTTTVKDSQRAFYVADVGIECALYWDFQTVRSAFDPTDTVPHDIECIGVSHTITGNGGPAQIFPPFPFATADYCLELSVEKQPGPPPKTILQSRGFSDCNPSNPRRVERAIDVTYTN
ncbi:MAG: hypothetical protein Q8R39_04010 [bacterium]|nr:hypothetical protein [bacterium]MDZ4285245.1 hypothetical protein [Patescibacteria group bacterium]